MPIFQLTIDSFLSLFINEIKLGIFYNSSHQFDLFYFLIEFDRVILFFH